MKLLLFVLDDMAMLDPLVMAWQAEGIDVISIVESSTLCNAVPLHLGARFGFSVPQRGACESGHYVLLALARREEDLARATELAQEQMGPLDDPDTGLLFAWPISDALGLAKLAGSHLTDGEGSAE